MSMNITSVAQGPDGATNRQFGSLELAKPRQLRTPNSTMTTMVSQGHFDLETKLANIAHEASQSNYFTPHNLDKKEYTSLQRKLTRDELRKLGYKDGEMVEWAGLIASNLDFDFYTRLQGLLFMETLVSDKPPEIKRYGDIRGMFDRPNVDAIGPAIEVLTYIASMQAGDDKIRTKAIKLLGDQILYPDTARTIGIALYNVIDAMADSPSARFWLAYAAQNIGGAEGYYILEKMNQPGYLDENADPDWKTKNMVRAGLNNLKRDMLDYYKWPRGADGLEIIPDVSLKEFLSMDPGRFVPRIDVSFQVIKVGRMMAEADPNHERRPKSRPLPKHPAFLPQVPLAQLLSS